jgi:predicted transcriptional regulator
MIDAQDKALLELAEVVGGIRVTQDNQSRLQRLAELGIVEKSDEGKYAITDAGRAELKISS